MNQDVKKAKFHEALAFLIESANINDGKVTLEEIHTTFEGIIDDDTMYQLIYDYLLENKITIQGYLHNSSVIVPSEKENADETDSATDISEIHSSTDSEDSRERNFVDMYYNDLKHVSRISEAEELALLETFMKDWDKDIHSDKTITHTLTEANLDMVLHLSEEYRNKGVSMGDLIQEGNLGLMEGIMTYHDAFDLTVFHHHLETCIRNALNDAIFEQNTSSRISTHAADRANELDRASVALSKELERTPTLEELAKYLSLSEDEVERIMKMSLNALTIDEQIDE